MNLADRYKEINDFAVGVLQLVHTDVEAFFQLPDVLGDIVEVCTAISTLRLERPHARLDVVGTFSAACLDELVQFDRAAALKK